ncbi:DUF2188 domain-containing protein [Hansschlegelia beijingensis]|uniref:Putative membrane protein YkoI n=1 Tax=Hansschlegelia beijingensis TaxID=1133344 RepID=A0A7W6GG83_9HYPH|nr:DUF2188 domain-containing protein [Hansschlegelia beijingensis]MBB3972439.1 putative membrane protein YkoI [Hansschlegelia beijingensis]
MANVQYEIVEHNDGWAYKLGDVFSETFPSREAAHAAAERAAGEQRVPGDATDIEYEDENGRWRVEHASADDRPSTTVKD